VKATGQGAELASMSRGDVKRLGADIDRDPALRAEWLERARRAGADLSEFDGELPGKKLVRLVLGRSDAAQVRTNPIARDEAFTCSSCGRAVPVGGRRPRDHCPWCLHSRHVDVVPGDRAESCGGLLVPVALEPGGGSLAIVYRCASCGVSRRNRVLDDLSVPDDPAALRKLAAAMSVSPPG
jgi:predicted RNA-binding Zn-ribbon protein involved in translation (DUF1610 family)